MFLLKGVERRDTLGKWTTGCFTVGGHVFGFFSFLVGGCKETRSLASLNFKKTQIRPREVSLGRRFFFSEISVPGGRNQGEVR